MFLKLILYIMMTLSFFGLFSEDGKHTAYGLVTSVTMILIVVLSILGR